MVLYLREQALIIINSGALFERIGSHNNRRWCLVVECWRGKALPKDITEKWVVLKQSMMENHLKIQGIHKKRTRVG